MALQSKRLFLLSVIAAVLISTSLAQAADALNTLTVRIDQISGRGSTLIVNVFTASTFAANTPVLTRTIKTGGDTVSVTFVGIPAGSYGVHAMLDVNQTGKQKHTLIGAAAQPYGYSNFGGRVRKPSFDEIAFSVGSGDNKAVVHLHN